MHLVSAGTGPTVLLLHAFPLDGRMWEQQIADLSPDYRVLAPDIGGFGRSTRPEGAQSIEEWARSIVVRCREEGVDRAVVAGCSMGGYIAFAIARLAPEFLSGLALIDTRAAADSQEVRRARYEMVELARHEGTVFLQSAGLPLSPYTLSDRPGVVAAVRSMMADATPVGVMAAQRAMASRKDATEELSAIAVPATVMHGDDDPVVPRAEARSMADAIPGATFCAVPLAGHLPPVEQPSFVSDALRELAARAFGHAKESQPRP